MLMLHGKHSMNVKHIRAHVRITHTHIYIYIYIYIYIHYECMVDNLQFLRVLDYRSILIILKNKFTNNSVEQAVSSETACSTELLVNLFFNMIYIYIYIYIQRIAMCPHGYHHSGSIYIGWLLWVSVLIW